MAPYIRAVREQDAITIFSMSNRKFPCAHSPCTLNELNLALTQQILAQHEKNVRYFLSILYRMQ